MYVFYCFSFNLELVLQCLVKIIRLILRGSEKPLTSQEIFDELPSQDKDLGWKRTIAKILETKFRRSDDGHYTEL